MCKLSGKVVFIFAVFYQSCRLEGLPLKGFTIQIIYFSVPSTPELLKVKKTNSLIGQWGGADLEEAHSYPHWETDIKTHHHICNEKHIIYNIS